MIAQLDFWQASVDALPWGGRSPRALTKSAMSLFLRREPQKDERFFVCPETIDMFGYARKEPPRYEGASLLLPLPEEVK